MSDMQEKPLIFIVDDQPLSVRLLDALLNQKGFRTDSAGDGFEALKYLEQNTPDVILLDVMMPGMSGFEVCRKLRQISRLKETPVIFVTARDDAETINECFDAGGSDYSAKPLRIYELLARINLQLKAAKNLERAVKSEAALDESESFLSEIINSGPSMYFVIDEDNVFQQASRNFASLFGLTPELILEKNADQLIEEGLINRYKFNKLMKINADIFASGKPRISYEDNLRIDEDIEHWYLCSRIPLTVKGRKAVFGVNLDITQKKIAEIERNSLEKQLVQSQKTEIIGTLAGGIAHDFNNLLAVILGYSDLARNSLPEDAKQHRYLKEVLNAGSRAKDLVKQILNFSRQTEGEFGPVCLSAILKEVVKMIKSTLPSNIIIKEKVASDLSDIDGDPTQLHQVIMNLMVNAKQAMPEGGAISVSLELYSPDSEIFDRTSIVGPYLHLSVIDTGCGMDEITKERIFEPYFTTKELEKGTGLGLAVVQGILKQHKGHVKVESQPGLGTSFHILFPLSTKKAIQELPDTIGLEKYDKYRVLVVDDEIILGELVKEVLTEHGFKVTLFHDSLEALVAYKEDPKKYDLILTDYMMPKMQGDALAAEIRKTDKETPIILATGFSQNMTPENATSVGIDRYLMKPIIGKDLIKVLHSCLVKK